MITAKAVSSVAGVAVSRLQFYRTSSSITGSLTVLEKHLKWWAWPHVSLALIVLTH